MPSYYANVSRARALQEGLWQRAKAALGGTPAGDAYQKAEDSARATLDSQVEDGSGKPSARGMQASDIPNSVTGERSWKIGNADLDAERADGPTQTAGSGGGSIGNAPGVTGDEKVDG